MIHILFLLGFILLIKGADWLVDASSEIAAKYGVSDIVIGLTVVSFGTSLPELMVNIMASFQGSSDLAIGNILGSNIANVLLILGASALLADLPVKRPTVLIEIPFSLTAVLLVGFLANSDLLPNAMIGDGIGRLEGVIIIVFFLLFMAYIWDTARNDKASNHGIKAVLGTKSNSILILTITGGILSLYLGGRWVVGGAVLIAGHLGMSEALIGLTVVAIGTSLPELVTAVVAAYKGNTDIAVGNVVGSNIFNLLWILGLSAIIKPLPFSTGSNQDVMVIITASMALLIALVLSRQLAITRWSGVTFLLMYTAYLIWLVYRG